MPKIGEAFVDIGAKLKPLKEGLARSKSMLKSNMGAMAKVARRGGLIIGAALAAGFTISTKAAMEQERADVLLAQSLANVGKTSGKAFKDLKLYAAELQKLTKYGDEATQQLMSLGINLGVSSDEIADATKGAIGLTAAMGGKMGLQDAMKNVALALQGEFTMLNRYIPELRSAATESEKMAILQRKMADGFKIAEAEAMTASGRMAQMKNDLGDAAETLGMELIPYITKAAKKISELVRKFSNLSSETKATIVKIAAITAGVAAFGVIMPPLIKSVTLLTVAFKGLAANIVLAKVAMVGLLFAFKKFNNTPKDKLDELIGQSKSRGAKAIAALKAAKQAEIDINKNALDIQVNDAAAANQQRINSMRQYLDKLKGMLGKSDVLKFIGGEGMSSTVGFVGARTPTAPGGQVAKGEQRQAIVKAINKGNMLLAKMVNQPEAPGTIGGLSGGTIGAM